MRFFVIINIMTLTELSYYIRKYLPYFILGTLIIFILYYSILLVIITNKPAEKKALFLDPIFGSIKKPLINDPKVSSGYTFTIDTIEGVPITATSSAKVYFLPTFPTRFGYREKLFLIAKTLGFDTEVTKYTLDGKEAIFKDDIQELKIDISNFNFTYQYEFENNASLFGSTFEPDKTQSTNRAVDLLRAIDRYPEELAQGKTNVIYISYDPQLNKISLTQDRQSANMVEVDLYRRDIDGYPSVSPSYFNSQNYVMMVPYANSYKIVKAQIQFFEKSQSQVGI